MGGSDAVRRIMGHLKNLVSDPVPGFVLDGPVQVVFPVLHILGKVSLADYIGHMGLNNLESILLQISLDFMVRPGMKIQQVFSYNQHLGPQPASVIGNCLQVRNRLGKTLFRPGNAPLLKALAQGVHAPLKGIFSAARLQLIGADLSQKSLQGIDHGHSVGDAHGGYHVHPEAGMDLVRILIIVGQNRNLGKSCVVQGFSQQLAVVGQAAVAHIFSHADGHMVQVIAAAL